MFNEVNKKKQVYELGIIFGWIFMFISFFAILFMRTSENWSSLLIFALSTIIGLLFIAFFGKKIKDLSNVFKQEYVTRELKNIFPDSNYYYNEGFTQHEVVASKLLKKQDRYSSEDLITGEFDGVGFKCSDVHQQDVRSSGKHTTVVTIFRGRVYEFDFFKNFKYNLLLLQPYNYRPFESYKKIKLESNLFNSEFKVYAKDEHEAFYILTPHFMERLLVLDRKYRDKISFSFNNNNLFIAVDNRIDTFDIKAFTPVSKDLIDSYVEEFKDMKEFITLLTLNSKLFKQ